MGLDAKFGVIEVLDGGVSGLEREMRRGGKREGRLRGSLGCSNIRRGLLCGLGRVRREKGEWWIARVGGKP